MRFIDWEIVIASTGKDKIYFDNHPNSHKVVYVRCPICGLWRWTQYLYSDKYCRSCSVIRWD